MKQEKYKIQVYHFNNSLSKKVSSGTYYTFLFLISGNCCFRENDVLHSCGLEDMILLKPGQSVLLNKTSSEPPLSLFALYYSPDLLKELSDDRNDMERSIQVVPFTVTSVRAANDMIALIRNLCRRLLTVRGEDVLFANPVFEKSILGMLLVLILRACIQAEFKQKGTPRKHFILDDLFVYIRVHITEEITLEQLEKVFYVSRYHILREFKKHTGQSVHKYIIRSKLELCKSYIEEGRPITEVYKMGGFGGYNHFFRAFKQEYGMTPREYYKSIVLPYPPRQGI